MSGSAGEWTFAQVGGRTVAKQKAARKDVPSRSQAQMARRVQWANLVNLYRALRWTQCPSFEDRQPGVSDYNVFMSANMGVVEVYLAKEEARQGGCVVAPYQVARGSLPSIGVSASGAGGEVGTDIALGSLAVDDGTTVALLSDAIVEHNPDFRFGDQISALVVCQMMNGATGVPYVEVRWFELTLDHGDRATLVADVDPGLLVFGRQEGGDRMGMNRRVDGGVVYVHGRRCVGRTLVSTQRMVVDNSLLARYQSEAKRMEAILSYGGKVRSGLALAEIG